VKLGSRGHGHQVPGSACGVRTLAARRRQSRASGHTHVMPHQRQISALGAVRRRLRASACIRTPWKRKLGRSATLGNQASA